MESIKMEYEADQFGEDFKKVILCHAPLLKLRILGYVSNRSLLCHNYLDAVNGKSKVFKKFKLLQLSDILNTKRVLLMDFMIDSNLTTKAIYPLNVVFTNNPKSALNNANIKELALSMHDEISENYFFKDIAHPLVIGKDGEMLYVDDFLNKLPK